MRPIMVSKPIAIILHAMSNSIRVNQRGWDIEIRTVNVILISYLIGLYCFWCLLSIYVYPKRWVTSESMMPNILPERISLYPLLSINPTNDPRAARNAALPWSLLI